MFDPHMDGRCTQVAPIMRHYIIWTQPKASTVQVDNLSVGGSKPNLIGFGLKIPIRRDQADYVGEFWGPRQSALRHYAFELICAPGTDRDTTKVEIVVHGGNRAPRIAATSGAGRFSTT